MSSGGRLGVGGKRAEVEGPVGEAKKSDGSVAEGGPMRQARVRGTGKRGGRVSGMQKDEDWT